MASLLRIAHVRAAPAFLRNPHATTHTVVRCFAAAAPLPTPSSTTPTPNAAVADADAAAVTPAAGASEDLRVAHIPRHRKTFAKAPPAAALDYRAIEDQTTGDNADPGGIPRDGAMPVNPYLPLTQAELDAMVGATCPNWSWTEAHPNSQTTAEAISLLAYPRPLPPVYKHAGYRTTPELADRKRRMLHIFTCMLTGALGLHMVFNVEQTNNNGKPDVLTPLRQWAKRTKAELLADPAVAYAQERAADEKANR